MVKVGFIVEGDSEKVLIESAGFRQWAGSQGLEICSPVINAKGGGNLLPHHIKPMLAQIERSQPDHIVILTDLEDATDVETVKTRITTEHTNLIFIAVKALEAWFLADTDAMRRWLNAPEFFEKMETQEVRAELSRARDAANAISTRMAKVLDQNRNATYRQSEAEKNGQDSSENVKDKKENPEPEKKEQKSRGQHRKEAR